MAIKKGGFTALREDVNKANAAATAKPAPKGKAKPPEPEPAEAEQAEEAAEGDEPTLGDAVAAVAALLPAGTSLTIPSSN